MSHAAVGFVLLGPFGTLFLIRTSFVKGFRTPVLAQFETGLSLECGDLSPLWSAATCRSLCRLNSVQEAASSRRGQKR